MCQRTPNFEYTQHISGNVFRTTPNETPRKYKYTQSPKAAVPKNWRWKKTKNCDWAHNHDASMSSTNTGSASGLVHLRLVAQLSVEQKSAIMSYLDSGLSIETIRFKFRAKFVGYELRARTAKVIKMQVQCH